MSEPTIDELREALRVLSDKLPPYEYAPELVHVLARIADVQAELRQQQARIEALETALLPFAVRYPTEHMDLMPDLDKWTPVYQWVDKPSELLPGTPVIYIGEFRAVNAVYPYTPSWGKPDDDSEKGDGE